MKRAARAWFGLIILLGVTVAGVRAASGEATPAPANDPAKPKVLEVNKRDSVASARFRIAAVELRDILFRLLDEDGFHVTRKSDAIPAEGKTFKGKKRLRRVEWEIIPGQEEGTSVLSIEYSRFGNRAWAEHALSLVVEEIGKHDPPPESVAKPVERDATAADASPIKGPNYLDSRFEKGEKEDKNSDLVFPIPPLAISSAKPKAPTSDSQKPAGEKAEMLQEPSEEVFRGVQRGEISESDGAERIAAFLQIFWLDAGHAPEENLRKTLSGQVAHALAQRQLASKEAAGIVELLDRGVRPERIEAEAAQRLREDLKAKLKAADLDDAPRSEMTKTMLSILDQ